MPELQTHAPFLLALLLVVFWVYMKVKLARDRLGLRDEGEAPPDVPRWQLRLAGARATNVVLAVVALILIALLAWLGVVAD